MSTDGKDVVVIGGGVTGIATAYFLGKAGVKSVVVERDSVGSHASGFAYGGLSPLGGTGIPGPIAPVAREGMRLHRELAESLPEETGVNTEYRTRPSLALVFTDLALVFTDQEAQDAKAGLEWQQQQEGFDVHWLEPDEARKIEPRISAEISGAVYTQGTADVEPYRFILALAQASENRGATIRHGRVTGLRREGRRVSSMILENGEIPCERVVLAMGPWSEELSSWLNVPIEVGPLKGQILRLRAPGTPLGCSVGWAKNYAATKPDGLLWAGTTEEEAGFNESPTAEGRDSIMASLTEAQLVQQTACLRPFPSDEMLVMGAVPGWEGAYIATGAGRKGILLGPAKGRITADLIVSGKSDTPLDAFDPGRFAM